MPAPQRPQPQIGDLVGGRYRLLAELGQGGMGTVYEAEQAPLGRRVALKILRLRADSPADDAYDRFLRESQAIARLSHPNVVTCHDFGIDDQGYPYLVMERVSGCTLRACLRQHGPLPWPRALRIIRDIAKALRVAHQQGIIHRDLKPENVMIVDDGTHDERAMVLDFGLAKLNTQAVTTADAATGEAADDIPEPRTITALTQEGLFLGTPGYVAPEFAAEGIGDDPRSDFYALGVILFEMLTGQPPFAGQTPLALMMAHMREPAPRLADVAVDPSRPPELEALVSSLLAKSPAQRPMHAEALLTQAEAVLSSSHDGSTPTLTPVLHPETSMLPVLPAATQSTETFLRTLDQGPPPAQVTEPSAARLRRPRQRHRAAGLVLGTIALLGAGYGLWWFQDSARACARGNASACFAWAEALDTQSPDAAAEAFAAYQMACERGHRPACERLQRPWRGGSLRRGFLGERGPLDPYARRALAGRQMAQLVFDRFTHIDEAGRITPGALQSWEEEDEGRTLRLVLREGIQFHPHPACFPDGRRATPQDVARSLEEAVRRWPFFDLPIDGRDAFLSGHTDRLEGVQARAADVVVKLKHPAIDIGHALSLVWLLPEVSGGCENLRDFVHPAGTGDFRFETSRRSGHGVLTRAVPHNGAPYVEEIEFIPVGDPEEALAWMHAGRIDVIEMSNEEAAPLLEEDRLAPRGAPSHIHVGEMVLTGMLDLTMLELNALRVPAFQRVEVRQAVASIFKGQPLAAGSSFRGAEGRFLPSWVSGFDPRLSGAPNENPAAQQVRARLFGALPPLTFGYPSRLRDAATAIHAALERAGLTVSATELPGGGSIRLRAGFDLYLAQIRQRLPNRDATAFLSVLPATFRSLGHELPNLDLFVEMVRRPQAKGARQSLPSAFEAELLRELPAIPLLHGPQSQRNKIVFFHTRVHGYVDDVTSRVIGSDASLWLTPGR